MPAFGYLTQHSLNLRGRHAKVYSGADFQGETGALDTDAIGLAHAGDVFAPIEVAERLISRDR
ncbi:hypothetical protein CA833_05325 [Novosphingobium sp. KA1]|nr:hypothetical protein CA833_05325 [Novosphingobium sp. KA1]